MKDSDGSKFESTDKILDSCKNYYQELTTNPAKDIEERVIEEAVNKTSERIIKKKEKEISPPISIEEGKKSIKGIVNSNKKFL